MLANILTINMAQNDNKKQLIFDKYSSNLNFLNENNFINSDTDVYICPLCIEPHKTLNESNPLTLEDAPPKSLSGKANTLTCKKCNNQAGHKIDFHLAERLNEIENKKFTPNTSINVRTKIGTETFNGTLSVDKDGTMTMLHSNKNNHPEKLKTAIENLSKDHVVDFDFLKSRIVPEKLEYALLKAAFIILFEETGYALILDKTYDFIREQISKPEIRIYPENFWFNNTNNIKDGVYFNMTRGMESIIVAFNLKTDIINRGFLVMLPIPNTDFINVIKNFNKAIEEKSTVTLYPVEGEKNDYLGSIETLEKMYNWIEKTR